MKVEYALAALVIELVKLGIGKFLPDFPYVSEDVWNVLLGYLAIKISTDLFKGPATFLRTKVADLSTK